jgi:hypothetical protein
MSTEAPLDEKRSVRSENIAAPHKGVHVDDVLEDAVVDPVYHAKARILNDALQEIGMGKYQVCLVNIYSRNDLLNAASSSGSSSSSPGSAGSREHTFWLYPYRDFSCFT